MSVFMQLDCDRFATALADYLEGDAPDAVRAAVEAADRARDQRAHVRRLKAGARAPVVTLPYLFEEALGLDEYRELAERLARRLSDQAAG